MKYGLFALLLLPACMTVTGFRQGKAEVYCEKFDECLGLVALGTTLEECYEDTLAEMEDNVCDDFNSESAAECLEDMENATCATFISSAVSADCRSACD
jgi:hypothetical protein